MGNEKLAFETPEIGMQYFSLDRSNDASAKDDWTTPEMP